MEGISGVFARTGEEDGDLEHEEFGESPDYESCHTVQSVYLVTQRIGEIQMKKGRQHKMRLIRANNVRKIKQGMKILTPQSYRSIVVVATD